MTGTLPVANGGTASSTALGNNYVMVSSGSAIVESTLTSAALNLSGQLTISDSSGYTTLILNNTSGVSDYLVLQNTGTNKVGYGYEFSSATRGIRIYDFANAGDWLYQPNKTSGAVCSLYNTLDDGSGNLTCANSIKANTVSANYIASYSGDLRINSDYTSGTIYLSHDNTNANVVIGAGSTNNNFVVQNTTSTNFQVSNTVVSTLRNILDDGSGNMTVASGILFPTTGGTPTSLTYYEEYTLSTTFSGPFATTAAKSVQFTRCGRMVTVTFPSVLSNGNSVSALMLMTTNPPARFCPAAGLVFQSVSTVDNGISTTGYIQASVSLSGWVIGQGVGNAFSANTGVTGLVASSISYSV
jgi:hypothetical protein